MGLLNPKIVVEFKDFLLKTNMFALALAVVIGAAVGKLVEAFVADLIMPVVAVVLPADADWSLWTIGFWKLRFPLGHFFGAVLNFAIIAAVVFFLMKLLMKPASPPPSKTCPQCLESIHPDAKRCKFCTSTV
jgi:large conductance mechanosensitive channel